MSTVIVKCPACDRIPEMEIPADRDLGFCAQCYFGEGRWVRRVVVAGTSTAPIRPLRLLGVGRVAGAERELSLHFNRLPCDDEMRELHEALNAALEGGVR